MNERFNRAFADDDRPDASLTVIHDEKDGALGFCVETEDDMATVYLSHDECRDLIAHLKMRLGEPAQNGNAQQVAPSVSSGAGMTAEKSKDFGHDLVTIYETHKTDEAKAFRDLLLLTARLVGTVRTEHTVRESKR